jgi:cell division protein YceG involved in septum cleavage
MKIVYDAFANKSVFLGNYTLRAEMRNYLINRYFAGGKSSRPCDIIIEGKRYRETMEKVDSSNSVQLRLRHSRTKKEQQKSRKRGIIKR